MNKGIASILFFLLIGPNFVIAQSNTALKIDKKIPITGSEKFDFIFSRSIFAGKVENVPYAGTRSGCYSFGIGYGFPIGKSLELKIEPRVLWQKFYFATTADKWFPTGDTSQTLIYEKQRMSYVELPVALKFKLARNSVDRYKLLLEMGFVFGRKVGGTFKNKRYTAIDSAGTLLGPKITTKVNRIEELNNYRFGPFVRLGTNWIAGYAFYRLTDVFKSYRHFDNGDGTSRPYPGFPKLEIGISFAL